MEYYATDAVGSIRVVFDASGNVLGRQDYAPFGKELFTAPALPAERFGGQPKDGEIDQSYFNARNYQARTGRFTRPDPAYGSLPPQLWNRYSYVLNNPVRHRDPLGLCPTDYCEEVIVVGEDPGEVPPDIRELMIAKVRARATIRVAMLAAARGKYHQRRSRRARRSRHP